MSNRFFTSDLHLGHKAVATSRGFSSPEEHDEAVISGLADLRKSDTLYILGDLCLGNPEYALETLSKVAGTKKLISGNHDKCHPMNRPTYRTITRYLEVFDSINSLSQITVTGTRVMLSHFPYTGDSRALDGSADRHTEWRPRDSGYPLVHGHIHSSRIVQGNQIHVGLDAHQLRPVPVEDICRYLAQINKGN